MDKWTLAFVVGALAIYLYWPPPEVSSNLSQWRSEGDYIMFIGHKVFYRDEPGSQPEGPVLVCLHGFPTSSYDWVKVLPTFKERFSRIILPDFIGFGFSDKPRDHQYSLMEQADIVEKILHDHDITSVHILSHDYGDTVAQELVHRFESRKQGEESKMLMIESLCMLNGGIFPETNFPSPIQKILTVPLVGSVLCQLLPYFAAKYGLGRVFGPNRQPTEADMKDFWASIRLQDGHLVLNKLLGYMSERWSNKDRWVGALQRTSVPIHGIYGPADVINPPSPFVDHYKMTLPRATLTVLDNEIGHYPQWEDPEAVAVEYMRFLAKLGV